MSNNRAGLAAIGAVMESLQSAVNAIGAALTGNQSKTRLPVDLLQRLGLTLVAAPAPGSVILHVGARQDALTELYPNGPDLFGEDLQQRPLIDQAIQGLAELLGLVVHQAPVQEAFTTRLRELGPRSASSVKGLADALQRGQFDSVLRWNEPGERSLSVEISEEDARAISSAINTQDIEETEVEIQGVIETASSHRRLEVDGTLLGESGVFSVARGSLDDAALRGLHVFSHVRLLAMMIMEQRPGGETVPRFEAISVVVTDDPNPGQPLPE